MSSVLLFPTCEEALLLHEWLLERFGGAPGVRDGGLLDSALARPRSGYYETLSMAAAALLQSLARDRSFVDGNKRLAYALTATFLAVNGWAVVADADEAETFLIERVIRGHAELDEIAGWLEAHLVAG
jgi:death-on-curing protein